MPSDRVTLYRIVHERYAEAPFSGEGGLHYRSRWASKGQRVSYAADHLALATLEKIASVQRADLLSEMVFVRAEIAVTRVEELSNDHLPDGWDALPAGEAARAVGDAWIREARSAVLRVPSVMLPHSYNYVVNAAHSETDGLRILEAQPLLLDNRVLQRLGAASS